MRHKNSAIYGLTNSCRQQAVRSRVVDLPVQTPDPARSIMVVRVAKVLDLLPLLGPYTLGETAYSAWTGVLHFAASKKSRETDDKR